MKRILTIKLLFLTAILFSQNKHSELYNKVDSIYKSNKKTLIDSIHRNRLNLNNEIESEFRNILLIIDGIPQQFEILDLMDLKNISSINFSSSSNSLHSNIILCKPIDGIILIQSIDVAKKQIGKKKRKSKSNH